MYFELVVLDLIGTTAVDGGIVAECLRAAMATADVAVTAKDVLGASELPARAAIRSLVGRHRLDIARFREDEITRIHEAYEERVAAALGACVREVYGISAMLARLREDGLRVAIETPLSRCAAEAALQRLGWRERGLVDAVVTADDVARARPHPDAIREAMRRTRTTSAGRVVKVGDSPLDLEQGVGAGCAVVVGVTNGASAADELRAPGFAFLLPTAALLGELLRRLEERPPVTVAFAWGD